MGSIVSTYIWMVFMDDNSFEKTLNSIETQFEQKHDNEGYQELMKLLIQKKAEYDIEKLKAQSKYNNDFMNNCFKYFMKDEYFKQRRDSANDGYKDVEFSIDDTAPKIEQGVVSDAKWTYEPDNEQERDYMETGDEDENSDVEEEEDSE